MLPAITVESLKEDKGYNKAAKKYIKEHDGLMKKLTKERTNIASNQCKAMEKLAKSKKWVCTQNVVMGQVYPSPKTQPWPPEQFFQTLKTRNQKSVKILKTEPDKTQRWRNWNQNLMNFQKPVEPEP